MEMTQTDSPTRNAIDAAAARWRAGNESAAAEVWQLCGGRLLRLARTLTRSQAAAEDAVQEAFLRAWRGIRVYDPQRPFEPWITTITVRECRRAARREARKPLPQPQGAPDADDLFTAIEALPQPIKETVALHYLIGYNVGETAAALGIPQGTVKSRLHRARALLAAELREG